MATETVSATRTIAAPAETVFDLLADPTTHPSIDGTGWVSKTLDPAPLTSAGQVFRMAMYHANHPDKNYEMSNQVTVFEPSTVIAWRPGQPDADGTLRFGGWFWRYDITDAGDGSSDVTLTYDWSGAIPWARHNIQFPPFPPDHLDNSLEHLAELAEPS